MKNNIWEGKHGPLLIAEIGGNHEGDFNYAKKLTELAIESDVDYIKFQLYQGDTLVNKLENPTRNSHFKKFELKKEEYIELATMCHNNDVGFMASVWDLNYIDWIDPFIDIYKIGSGDLTAYNVLKYTASFKKPIILSTGLSTTKEVIDSVQFLQSVDEYYQNKLSLAVLQCTSMYPIPNSAANLNVMLTYKDKLGIKVGYSDHTVGPKALEIATAMGADILEFHFTDSRENKTFRDHLISLTKEEVLSLIEQIKSMQILKGDHNKTPLDIESDHLTSFRRGVYPKMDLPKGTIIEEHHLISLRPNYGIDARYFYELIGKKTLVDIKSLEKLNWNYFK